MLQIIINKFDAYFRAKNRWWIPLITGLLYSLSLPPFNHELHWALVAFPFLSFIILIPLLYFSVQTSFKRALQHLFLYSFSAALGQYYWIGFVTADGLWHLILIGLFLICGVISLWYSVAGLLFRFTYKNFRRFYILLFPAFWVLVDFSRTLGDISFPWAFLGYNFSSVLPLAQSASLTGVWGLTFLVLLGNMLFWEVLVSYKQKSNRAQKWIHVSVFALFLIGLSVYGFTRMNSKPEGEKSFKVALLQSNIDQFNWGNHSLDSAFAITEHMVYKAAQGKPDLIIGPESALLCYLSRRSDMSRRVLRWADSTGVPMIFGALHWEKPVSPSYYDYLVYNAAFLVDPRQRTLKPYKKMKLVPFSEAIPFEARLPLLSRINLGEADFQRGDEPTIYSFDNDVVGAPFICYEIIFPGFVQKRVRDSANLIITITNDGWFGKTTGPFHHAAMARMRAIENGIPLVRSANSGISMIVDQYGRVMEETDLYTRTILSGTVHPGALHTLYGKWGDWFVWVCLSLCSASVLLLLVKKASRRQRHRSVSKKILVTRTPELISGQDS